MELELYKTQTDEYFWLITLFFCIVLITLCLITLFIVQNINKLYLFAKENKNNCQIIFENLVSLQNQTQIIKSILNEFENEKLLNQEKHFDAIKKLSSNFEKEKLLNQANTSKISDAIKKLSSDFENEKLSSQKFKSEIKDNISNLSIKLIDLNNEKIIQQDKLLKMNDIIQSLSKFFDEKIKELSFKLESSLIDLSDMKMQELTKITIDLQEQIRNLKINDYRIFHSLSPLLDDSRNRNIFKGDTTNIRIFSEYNSNNSPDTKIFKYNFDFNPLVDGRNNHINYSVNKLEAYAYFAKYNIPNNFKNIFTVENNQLVDGRHILDKLNPLFKHIIKINMPHQYKIFYEQNDFKTIIVDTKLENLNIFSNIVSYQINDFENPYYFFLFQEKLHVHVTSFYAGSSFESNDYKVIVIKEIEIQ